MGTNYYLHRNVCPHCGREEAKEHVGKSSAGWRFTFATDFEMPRSWVEWKARISEPGSEFRDEYGNPVSIEEFEAMLERKREGRDHVAQYGRERDFHDPEGHPFTYGEFS